MFDAHAGPVAGQRDNQSQTDRRFRGRHCDDEERQNLAALFEQVVTEGREIDVDGIEHDLQGHEHEDDVAPAEEADQTDGEEDRAEPQKRARGDHQDGVFLRATTTAPTMATRRTSDTTSKGSANSVKSAIPTAATCGTGAASAVAAGAGVASPGSCQRARKMAKAAPAAAASGQWAPNRRPAVSLGRSSSMTKNR